ncbi:MAG: sulfite exporter TauE/SafE family protein [Anaerolineae bacterium]|nr:sulfite exporter TauE/SafE family protein [Anaerolineae bacterium]
MNELILAFITGLTTGGLSCLAVQGGLLASSLATQIERDLLNAPPTPAKKGQRPVAAARPNTALPILLFLAAKLVVYTLLGALLGWLGSFLTFDPITRALLMIAIAIFMIGNGLRMLNVHPIFRYFAIEPPKFITRYIRRTAKGTDTATPLFLGALTVFIPCGVTQAMMATALGTGDPFTAAALMFAFTLGTSPVFFAVAYFATQIGSRLEGYFMKFVAITVLILGFVTFDSALNLLGSPYSMTNLTRSIFPAAQTVAQQPAAEAAASLTLRAENYGYNPQRLIAQAGVPVMLNVVTEETYSCARDFVIPALKFYALLPETGTVPVEIPPQSAGTVMRFTCSMEGWTSQDLLRFGVKKA